MGGFTLTGPNYKFVYVSTTDYMCKCIGYHSGISKSLEDILLKNNKISRKVLIQELRKDGRAINDNEHLGLEANEVYNYIYKKI